MKPGSAQMASKTHPSTLPLAVTMGDPSGIGPDITLMSWHQRFECQLAPFVVLGCPLTLHKRAADLGLPTKIATIDRPEQTSAQFTTALPVYPLELPQPAEPGKPGLEAAKRTIEAIVLATRWARKGRVSGLVTGPINKKHLMNAGFTHPGHTEYLAELCWEAERSRPPKPVMMLAAASLRVIPATIHIPLRDVPDALTQSLIVETASITARALQDQFRIATPRIAITGLNPHAGEGGMLGSEETEIIEPAIRELRQDGIEADGPLPGDTAFQPHKLSRYDAIIAMYHDQALIPIKALAFDEAVNVTLGLPIVRTSPDHGTAYDLAATGKANPGSMIAALRLAQQLGAPAELAVT